MALNHRNIVVLCTLFTVSAAREGVHGAGSHARHSASRSDALRTGHAEEFNYIDGDPKGPDKWPEVFEEDCAGSSQSPVDILISETEDMDLPEPLQVPDFEWAPAEVNIVNEGHTVKLLPVKSESSPLRGGPLTGDYVLKELHFHWGAVNEEGSEHAIDSHYYAMEMHMVFDRKATRGRRPFRGTPGDTVVLAVFLKLAGDDNPALEPVVAALADVVEVGAAVAPKDAVSTADLLPAQREPMLVYNGSFTTPPCKETVTWILFEDPITVSGAQKVCRAVTAEGWLDVQANGRRNHRRSVALRCRKCRVCLSLGRKLHEAKVFHVRRVRRGFHIIHVFSKYVLLAEDETVLLKILIQ